MKTDIPDEIYKEAAIEDAIRLVERLTPRGSEPVSYAGCSHTGECDCDQRKQAAIRLLKANGYIYG